MQKWYLVEVYEWKDYADANAWTIEAAYENEIEAKEFMEEYIKKNPSCLVRLGSAYCKEYHSPDF